MADTGKDKVRRYQATEIAKMYFLENMTQEEIAKVTNHSRPNISRILSRCIQEGIVEIKVHDRMSQMPELALKIKRCWQLDDVFIASTSSDEDRTRRNIGELAAEYLASHVADGMYVGTTAGRISYYTARSMGNADSIKAHVVQLIGDTKAVFSPDSGQGLASLLAKRLGGACYVLQAPIFVKNTSTKNVLLSSGIISACYEKYAGVDIALLEIDLPQLHRNTLPLQSWLSQADMVQLNEVGAVSSICGRYFDMDGYPCNANINERVIGIHIGDLRKVPAKIGLASGVHLARAVESCLRARLLNILIIDESLAKNLSLCPAT